MGLLRADGSPKAALPVFAQLEGQMGICQWFHFEDPRLDDAVNWLRRLGVRKLRTGLSWADWFRPGALEWFDRQMKRWRSSTSPRSEEHTSELTSLMSNQYDVVCS